MGGGRVWVTKWEADGRGLGGCARCEVRERAGGEVQNVTCSKGIAMHKEGHWETTTSRSGLPTNPRGLSDNCFVELYLYIQRAPPAPVPLPYPRTCPVDEALLLPAYSPLSLQLYHP